MIRRTLHYGGTAMPSSPTGLSPKPQAGHTFKKLKRLEMIVRMETAGLPEAAISAMLAITIGRLRYIKKGPDYLQTRMRLVHGIILDTDQQLAVVKEQRKEMLSQLLPPALQVIANAIMKQPQSLAEQKLQISTAQDLLDREGTFAKVSRTEIKPVSFFDFENSDKEAHSVLDMIRLAATRPESAALANPGAATGAAALLEANKIFANSDTISATDQEALLDELEAQSAALLLEEPVASDRIQ